MPQLDPNPELSLAETNMSKLAENEYPGRIIAMGVSELGDLALQAYAIMGRSEGSRNRIFVQDQFGVYTAAPNKTPDEMAQNPMAELIYYRALREVGGVHVVSNGTQTEPVLWNLLGNDSFNTAVVNSPVVNGVNLSSFEPDEPNFTPRISGVIDFRNKAETKFGLSVTRRSSADRSLTLVSTIDSAHSLMPGLGYAVQTYMSNAPNGQPLPSFNGEPYPIVFGETAEETAQDLWSTLNNDNRVAVVVKSIGIEDGREKDCVIINGKEL